MKIEITLDDGTKFEPERALCIFECKDKGTRQMGLSLSTSDLCLYQQIIQRTIMDELAKED